MVNFDSDLHIRDMYFQFVEMENKVEISVGLGFGGRKIFLDRWLLEEKMIYKEDSLVYRPFT